jgi:hypothetical protein
MTTFKYTLIIESQVISVHPQLYLFIFNELCFYYYLLVLHVSAFYTSHLQAQ